MRPAAPASVLAEARDRRFGDDTEADPLGEVMGRSVDGVDDRGTGRTGSHRPDALRIHEVVEEEALLPGREELREPDRTEIVLVRCPRVERVVGLHLPARGKGAALRGDLLEASSQLDLLPQQRVARPPVLGAFAGESTRRFRHSHIVKRPSHWPHRVLTTMEVHMPSPILVVDDDPKIVSLVKTYLEREGFRVVA